MKFRTALACCLVLASTIVLSRAVPISDPETVLREIVARQNAMIEKATKDENVEEESLRADLQQICNEYDILIKDHPKYAPAYVAYGLLLNKVDMRKESTKMLLAANQLDKNIPVVKNQLGNYLAEEGKPVEAAPYYLAAIQLAPKEPLYHYQLGTLLTEARDDFLNSGHWTREQLDKAMHEAFRQAMELTPGNVGYAYRYGESFYDLEHPEWEEALEFWRALEAKVSPGVEKQTIRLHEANVLLKQGKKDDAKTVLDGVTEQVLQRQKQKLVDQLAEKKTS
jgi:tetratricopeptide (TPR) repeat protein